MKMNTQAIMAAAALILTAAVFFYCENNIITKTRLSIGSERIKSAFRIILISDLHGKLFGKNQSRLIQKIEEEHPDIICFSGDLTDGRDKKGRKDINGIILLSNLAKKYPVFYIPGNHEYNGGERIENNHRILRKNRVRVIPYKTEDILINGNSIRIAGFEERLEKVRFEPVMQKLREHSGFRILLSHYPHMFEEYAGQGPDLMLSGHAHGGQIRLPFTEGLYAPDQGFLPKYTSRLHENKGMYMAVSRGLGGSIFPTRLFNRPEIVIIDIHSKEEREERESI